MIRRAFKYNPLLGLFLIILMISAVCIMGWLAAFYFDFFSENARVPYLKSWPVKIFFVSVGMLFGIGLVSTFLRR